MANLTSGEPEYKYKNSDKAPYEILNIVRHGLKRVGVQFETADKANECVKRNPFNSGDYKVCIPVRMVTTMGLTKDIGLDITGREVVT
ncbi:hypothetical protein HHI36_019680, partial [Cryptolaemus montrouzieri]